MFALLILVDLLTIIVCSVDIGGLADHQCFFCWYWWTCWPSLFVLFSPPISTEKTLMVSNSTNINRTNNDGQQVHQYQQNKHWWLTSPPISTEQTMMVSIIVCSVDIGWLADHHCLFCWYWWTCWPSVFVLLILVDLLTIIVCSVDIGGLVNHQCLFYWYWWTCWPSLFALLILVDLLTIIVCSVDIGGLANHHCLLCWYWWTCWPSLFVLWLASPPISTEQTMMVNKSTNINRTNNDG
jgi:uncharacterized membrane protein YciS (DUF1049 family)